MSVWAIIVAAGAGERAGGGMPKQYRNLQGIPVLRKTVLAFLGHPEVAGVQVVYNPTHKGLYQAAVGDLELPAPVSGGITRQGSVFRGLIALEEKKPKTVLIHDAARAFVSADVISRIIAAVIETGHGAIPTQPIPDTIKSQKDGNITGTIDRQPLVLAQTPQGFPFSLIVKAHERSQGQNLTDDAAVAENAGMRVKVIKGDKNNIKLTVKEDFMANLTDVRTGTGFDVHAFKKGNHVILCGVKISFKKSLKGHSDADVALHAITDALLGAIGEGDIGDHFPPSEKKWQGAASDIFLKHAVKLVGDKGGQISSIDLTLICEAPKIGPHREAMRKSIAAITGVEVERISVKATTTEKLGFTGRGEGIAAQALATVIINE
ncbi:MAG: bifunctional 2-C-methyl-D-erythritol 4-phosphate cytidylyltransferase/2-C-methyl-D-erythritol 2,4-cyclodiphosphate synthase [Alphaproteobacteria bacterium]